MLYNILLDFLVKIIETSNIIKQVKEKIMKTKELNGQMSYYQVRKGGLVKYTHSEFRSEKQKEMDLLRNGNSKVGYLGQMSLDAQKRLKQKVEMWYQAVALRNQENRIKGINAQIKFVFVTLTLPCRQFHSDKTIKSLCLKPFLRIMRERFHVERYIWKAEKQENGNIHFHLLFDTYVDKINVDGTWHKCLNQLGYIDRFEEKHGHRTPPACRIESVKGLKGVLNYLVKYIAKNDVNVVIEGAVWKASKKVLTLQYFEFPADSELDLRIDAEIEKGKISSYVGERFAVYHIKREDLRFILGAVHWSDYLNYVGLVQCFLFENDVIDNFRDYAFLIRPSIAVNEREVLEVQKKSYPIPLQLQFQHYIDLKDMVVQRKLYDIEQK